LEPAFGQGISRALGRDLHGQGYRDSGKPVCDASAGARTARSMGKVNGDADVREITNPESVVRVQSTGLQTGESVLWSSDGRERFLLECLTGAAG
jgi:hypothetical protein